MEIKDHLPPLRKAALLFHVISVTFQAFSYIDEWIFKEQLFALEKRMSNVGNIDNILRQIYFL